MVAIQASRRNLFLHLSLWSNSTRTWDYLCVSLHHGFSPMQRGSGSTHRLLILMAQLYSCHLTPLILLCATARVDSILTWKPKHVSSWQSTSWWTHSAIKTSRAGTSLDAAASLSTVGGHQGEGPSLGWHPSSGTLSPGCLFVGKTWRSWSKPYKFLSTCVRRILATQ